MGPFDTRTEFGAKLLATAFSLLFIAMTSMPVVSGQKTVWPGYCVSAQ
jgi:hypothetical protein